MSATEVVLDHKKDRRLSLILSLSVVLLAGVLMFGIFALPAIFSASDNSQAIKQSQNISGCRSFFNNTVQDRFADLVIGELDRSQAEILEAGTAYKTALADYRQKVIQSEQDPARFIAECHKAGG